MPTPQLRGSILAQLQRASSSFDPIRGWINRYEFKGISQEIMLQLQQQYVQAGIACELFYNQGGTATLQVEDATGTYSLDVWEIEANEERRDIFSHPTITAILTPDEVAAVKQVIETVQGQISSGNQASNVILIADAIANDSRLDPVTGQSLVIITNFISLYLRGTEDYRHQQYVVKHTTNAPNRWNANISDFGVEQIYSPPQLLNELQNASLWLLPLPGRLSYKLSGILANPPPVASDPQNWLWGALKSAATETTAANNRINIVQDYAIEYWSIQPNGLYLPYGSDPPTFTNPI